LPALIRHRERHLALRPDSGVENLVIERLGDPRLQEHPELLDRNHLVVRLRRRRHAEREGARRFLGGGDAKTSPISEATAVDQFVNDLGSSRRYRQHELSLLDSRLSLVPEPSSQQTPAIYSAPSSSTGTSERSRDGRGGAAGDELRARSRCRE